MTNLDLSELARLEAETTAGEWFTGEPVSPAVDLHGKRAILYVPQDDAGYTVLLPMDEAHKGVANCRFAAAAHNQLPALLAHIARLEREAEAARGDLKDAYAEIIRIRRARDGRLPVYITKRQAARLLGEIRHIETGAAWAKDALRKFTNAEQNPAAGFKGVFDPHGLAELGKAIETTFGLEAASHD